MTHENRNQIICEPIPVARHTSEILALSRTQYEPIAMVVGFVGSPISSGFLVRAKQTGTLALWLGGHIETINQRKAAGAIKDMEARHAQN